MDNTTQLPQSSSVPNNNKIKKILPLIFIGIFCVLFLFISIPLIIYYIQKEPPTVTLRLEDYSLIGFEKATLTYETKLGNSSNFFPLQYLLPMTGENKRLLKSCTLYINNQKFQEFNTINTNGTTTSELNQLPLGQNEVYLTCKENSFLKKTGKSQPKSLLAVGAPNIEIENSDSSMVNVIGQAKLNIKVDSAITSDISEQDIMKYTNNKPPILECAVINQKTLEQSKFLVNAGEKTAIQFSNFNTGENNLIVECNHEGSNVKGISSVQTIKAIVPLSIGKILDIKTSNESNKDDLNVWLVPLQSSMAYGSALATLPTNDKIWSNTSLSQYDLSNGIVAITSAPGASISEQELTITTETEEYVIYIPAVSMDGQCPANFYVADDGSTFWQSRRKNSCRYSNVTHPDLTGIEALNPIYLARASSNFSFSPTDKLIFDTENSQKNLAELTSTLACSDIPCNFIGNAFKNSEGIWDSPPNYVSASYPYQINISKENSYDMRIVYRLGKNISGREGVVTDPPNTLSILIDDKEIDIHTVKTGEVSSAEYTTIFNLGNLKSGLHTVELYSEEKGWFVFSEFAIQPVGSFGEYQIKIKKSSYYDTDNDGLDDTLEFMYNTDKNNPDTDGDGYKDGEEVSHGHNPLKK